jgi:hypothetical protein
MIPIKEKPLKKRHNEIITQYLNASPMAYHEPPVVDVSTAWI